MPKSKLQNIFCDKQKSFTLIEIILYSAIVGVILITISGFIINIIGSKTKNDAYLEVQNNASSAMDRMTFAIENAKSIIPQTSNEIILLNMQKSPRLDLLGFLLINNQIYIWKGIPAGQPEPLTSEKVKINTLNFENLSYDHSKPIIQIKFHIEHTGTRQEYKAQMDMQNSVQIRSNQ